MQTINDSLMRARPNGTWNQYGKLRDNGGGGSHAPSASLSGRRHWGWITRAFSPSYNMTGLRPCLSGVDSVVGEIVRSVPRRSGMWVSLGKGGKEMGKWTGFSHFETTPTRLFPHKSTQVVDFPRICRVRLFWGSPEIRKTTNTTIGRLGMEGRLPLGTKAKSIISTHQDTLIFTLATPFKQVMIESRESEHQPTSQSDCGT